MIFDVEYVREDVGYRRIEELEAGLGHVRAAPVGFGTLELIACRPAVDERVILTEAVLDLVVGLVGDTWSTRGSTSTPDGTANPDAQLTVMNARAAALVAGPRERWALAGDQLYMDLDLSDEGLPSGSRLAIGDAVIEITDKPHTGCAKFAERFGKEALRFVNTGIGATLHLRGRNARVVVPGMIREGAAVRCIPEME